MEDLLHLRQDNRSDKKWAHPDALGGANWAVPGLLNTFFEMRDKDPAENIADRRDQRQLLLDDALANESEKRKASGEWRFVKAPGCPEEPDMEAEICLRIPQECGAPARGKAALHRGDPRRRAVHRRLL